jgi:hypothetical protein
VYYITKSIKRRFTMTRRTISLAEGIEDGVREVQIEMMRKDKRDVPFTEVVNWVLLQGLFWMAKSKGTSEKELGDQIMKWAHGYEKVSLDAFMDSIPTIHENEMLNHPSKLSPEPLASSTIKAGRGGHKVTYIGDDPRLQKGKTYNSYVEVARIVIQDKLGLLWNRKKGTGDNAKNLLRRYAPDIYNNLRSH